MATTLSTSFQTFCQARTPASDLKFQTSCLELLGEGKECAFSTPALSSSTSGSDINSDQDHASDVESREGGEAAAEQEEDVCMEQTMNTPTLQSSVDCHEIGEQILRTTEWYLRELRLKLPNTSFEEVMKAMSTAECAYSSENGENDWGRLALLLHGLRVASLLPTAQAEIPRSSKKNNRKRHLKSKQTIAKSPKKAHNKPISRKINGEPKAKTGRKPQIYECFMCHEVHPYKVNLIQHFQAVHNVQRSQSLLYKRVDQSPEAMKRLYRL
jgi:hypothetical protein